MKHNLQVFAKKILHWFVGAEFVGEGEGDPDELFYEGLSKQMLLKAQASFPNPFQTFKHI